MQKLIIGFSTQLLRSSSIFEYACIIFMVRTRSHIALSVGGMSKVVATLAVSAVAVITMRVVLNYLQIRLYSFLAMSVRPYLVVLPGHFADFACN